nr:hypothetical protein [uncultured Blautia sp.]
MDTCYGIDAPGCFELERLETGVLGRELLKFPFVFDIFDEEHDFP